MRAKCSLQEDRIVGKTKHFIVSLVLSVVVATLCVAPAVASEPVCSEGSVAETFAVHLSGYKAKYRVGDTVRLEAVVTRQVNGMDVAPAEGARVVVSVKVGRVVVVGGGTTDENGFVDVEVRLRRYVPAGRADVWTVATKQIEPVPCHTYEWGSLELPRLFKVTR